MCNFLGGRDSVLAIDDEVEEGHKGIALGRSRKFILQNFYGASRPFIVAYA